MNTQISQAKLKFLEEIVQAARDYVDCKAGNSPAGFLAILIEKLDAYEAALKTGGWNTKT